METNTDQKFIFGSDDDTFENSLHSQRIDKLSLKVTLMAILLPSVLIVVFIFMYLDMKNKVVQVHHTGSTEVQQTAEELKKIIKDLKESQTGLEKRLNENIASMGEILGAMEKNVAQHKKDIAYLANIKSDKKDLKTLTDMTDSIKADVASLTAQNGKLVTIAQQLQSRIKDLPSIQTDLESQKTALKGLNASLTDLTGGVTQLKTTVDTLGKNAVTNDMLTGELKKQKAFYRLELTDLSAKMNQKIGDVKKSIPSGSGGSASQ